MTTETTIETITDRLVPITCQPGGAVLLGDREYRPGHHAFARALAARASLRFGHPWVGADDVDDELYALARAALPAGTVAFADRWPKGPRDHLAGTLAHSAIRHHLKQIGCRVLSPEQVTALRYLVAHPEIAVREVMAYRGHSDFARAYRLLDLVLEDGSRFQSSEWVLDVAHFDSDDGQFGNRFESIAVRGTTVAGFVAELAA